MNSAFPLVSFSSPFGLLMFFALRLLLIFAEQDYFIILLSFLTNLSSLFQRVVPCFLQSLIQTKNIMVTAANRKNTVRPFSK